MHRGFKVLVILLIFFILSLIFYLSFPLTLEKFPIKIKKLEITTQKVFLSFPFNLTIKSLKVLHPLICVKAENLVFSFHSDMMFSLKSSKLNLTFSNIKKRKDYKNSFLELKKYYYILSLSRNFYVSEFNVKKDSHYLLKKAIINMENISNTLFLSMYGYYKNSPISTSIKITPRNILTISSRIFSNPEIRLNAKGKFLSLKDKLTAKDIFCHLEIPSCKTIVNVKNANFILEKDRIKFSSESIEGIIKNYYFSHCSFCFIKENKLFTLSLMPIFNLKILELNKNRFKTEGNINLNRNNFNNSFISSIKVEISGEYYTKEQKYRGNLNFYIKISSQYLVKNPSIKIDTFLKIEKNKNLKYIGNILIKNPLSPNDFIENIKFWYDRKTKVLVITPITIKNFFGGKVNIEKIKLENSLILKKICLQNISLHKILNYFHVRFPNSYLMANLDRIEITSGKIRAIGTFILNIFGGVLYIKNPIVKKVNKWADTLKAELFFENIHLERLSNFLKVGKITGKIKGYCKDLHIVNYLPQSFRIKIENRDGGIIGIDALNYMTRMGLINIVINLMDYTHYGYKKLFIKATLKNNILKIEGDIKKDGYYYLMLGKGFNKLNIRIPVDRNIIKFSDFINRLTRLKRLKKFH